LYLRSSSSCFFLSWVFQRSLASKVMPRYLPVLAYATFWLLIVIGMCSKHLLVKLIWTNLDSLNWMWVREFLLSFGAEPFVFQVAIQKLKD
jgi:hypothetical protein